MLSPLYPLFHKSLRAHSDIVSCVSFSSQKFATGSNDHSIIVWTFPRLSAKRLLGHTAAITSLQWHPSADWLASASEDGTVRIWNLVESKILYAHNNGVREICWSSDGVFLMTCSDDQTAKIWRFCSSKIEYLTTLMGHTAAVNSCQMSADSRLITTGSKDRTVKLFVFNECRARCLHTFYDSLCEVRKVRFNDSGSRVAAADVNGSIRIFDTRTLQMTSYFQMGDAVNSIQFSEKYLLSASDDGAIRIIDLRTDCLIYTIRGHNAAVLDVAISLDSKYFVSVGTDRRTLIWKMNASLEERKLIENAQVLANLPSSKLSTHKSKKMKTQQSGPKHQLYERLSKTRYSNKKKSKQNVENVEVEEDECSVQNCGAIITKGRSCAVDPILKVLATPSTNLVARAPEQITYTMWHIIKSINQIQNSIHQMQNRLSATETRIAMLSSDVQS